MEELKFRAYIKSLKFIGPVTAIHFDCKTVEVDISGGEGDPCEYDFNEVILMQYTGHKDKNGKKIFEGDRVKTSHPLCSRTPAYGIVEFDRNAAAFTINYEGYEVMFYKNDKIEILGTKWDNIK